MFCRERFELDRGTVMLPYDAFHTAERLRVSMRAETEKSDCEPDFAKSAGSLCLTNSGLRWRFGPFWVLLGKNGSGKDWKTKKRGKKKTTSFFPLLSQFSIFLCRFPLGSQGWPSCCNCCRPVKRILVRVILYSKAWTMEKHMQQTQTQREAGVNR